MSRIAYVNGRYLPRGHAMVHIEDRGYQFSDGVYEVCEVRGGRMIDERRHMARLQRSLGELRIRVADVAAALGVVMRESIRRNRVQRRHRLSAGHARGGAARSRVSAAGDAPEHRRHRAQSRPGRQREGGRRRASPSSRCRTTAGSGSTSSRFRCCPTCSPSRRRASRAPRKPGSWTGDGKVTEGSSSNAWIVTMAGKVVTRPADHGILRGITRSVLLEVIAAQGLTLEERAVHGRGGLRGARGLPHLGQPDRACRWCESTGGRSAMALPARSPPRCARISTATPRWRA